MRYFCPKKSTRMNTLTFDAKPLVTILLCTYNRAKYLQRCIESVLAQTNQDWELLVVDDGSKDDTFQIVDAFLQQHPNIRYMKHRNKKLALSRNVGIMASFGQYITFIDSDDLYKPNHIQSRVDYMLQHPEVDLIEGGIELEEEIFLADYYRPGQLINIRDCVVGPTFFGKRAVYFKLKGYNIIYYAEDAEFWERAAKEFKVAKFSGPETYVYSRADDSITKIETDKIST